MVMVGDSKKDDIEPASKLGINTIKVGKIKPGEVYMHYARFLREVPIIVDAIDTLHND